MFTRAWILALSVGMLLMAAAAGSSAASTANGPVMVRIPGHVVPALSKATKIARNPSPRNRRMIVTVVLKRDDQKGFETYLRDVYDPNSKNFHRYLTQLEIANRFGPSAENNKAVLAYLRARNLTLVQGSKNRLTLTVRGTRAQVERAFAVQIDDYEIGKRTFHANDRDPALPMQLAIRVQSIAGLSNYASIVRAAPSADPTFAFDPSSAASPDLEITAAVCFPFTPATGFNFVGVLAATYLNVAEYTLLRVAAQGLFAEACTAFVVASGVAWATCYAMAGQPHAAGFDVWQDVPQCKEFFSASHAFSSAVTRRSSRRQDSALVAASDPTPATNPQKIGLLEFDTYNPGDIQNWLALIQYDSSAFQALSTVPVNGGLVAPGPNEAEVLLDIDTVMTMLTIPGTKYVVYDAPPGTSFEMMLNAMINDHDTVISNSWAQCEDQTTLAEAQSIDMIIQQAAMSGISVINGSGDLGSTCLDGSANTIAVPADSPNALAVGGSSPVAGPGMSYGSETWWDGTNNVPPTGQGGYGLSKFFPATSLQSALSGSSMRSVPDVVADADPAAGLLICQADAGGCPSGGRYGGTSMAAPEWAAAVANLNAMLGSNMGNVNAQLYQLAGTNAFHDATALGSDFAHVGLGSLDFPALRAALAALPPGAPSPTLSVLAAAGDNPDASSPADGSTAAVVDAIITDANGFPLSGVSVSVTPNPSSQAVITPASALTDHDGIATFQMTDTTPENVTLTATAGGVTLANTPNFPFETPPATSGQVQAAPPLVLNDGVSTATITITLTDKNGNPTPGKQISISQTSNLAPTPASSIISGPDPAVTDASGTVQFTATDLIQEAVTYTAVDVTDGNLPIPPASPGANVVGFTALTNNNCSIGNPPAAPGFVFTPYATGFNAQTINYGAVNFGCQGATGLAFDSSGYLYVNDFPLGNIYKFPPSTGGVANAGTQLNNASLGLTLAGLAFDKSGNLFASLDVTTGNFATGAVRQIDPSNGNVIATPASNLTCPTTISIDPLSGDLFTDDSCSGGGSDNASIWRVHSPAGSPSTTVYGTLPSTLNATLAFGPGGTLYVWNHAQIAKVSGTNVAGPPTISDLPGFQLNGLGLLAGGTQLNGDAEVSHREPVPQWDSRRYRQPRPDDESAYT